MKALKMTAIAAVAFLAVMVAETSQVVAEGFLVSEEQQMLTLVNQDRAAHGLQALGGGHPGLKAIARRQAQAMAAAGYIYHTPDLAEQARQHSIDYSLLGENVGVGPSVEAVQQAFMDSPDHRWNILEPKFTEIGIGASAGGGDIYFSQNSAALRSAPPKAAPASSQPQPQRQPKKAAPTRPARAPKAPAPAVAPQPTLAPEKPNVDYVDGLDRFPTMAGTTEGSSDTMQSPAVERSERPSLLRTLGALGGRFLSVLAFWR